MESFKIYFGLNNDIRRVSLPKDNFDEVIKQLYALYSSENLYHGELRIQYVDEEGDKITVSSQGEWEEMQNASGASRPIKLWIAEGMNRGYFKDGPAPQVLGLIGSEQNSIPLTGEVANTVSVVIESLGRLFPGGKILPFNLPTWLKESGAISVKHVPDANQPTEDLSVDLIKLADALRSQALVRIRGDSSKSELEEAKLFLETVLVIFPGDANSHYNLACAESLMNVNLLAAIKSLETAVEKGYNNVAHMEADSDLDNLRNLDQYKDLVKKMKQESSMDQVVSQFEHLTVKEEPKTIAKVEEQVEEPKIVEKVEEDLQVKVEEVKSKKYAEFVPFLQVLGIEAKEAERLLEKHQGSVPAAADEFYRLV